MLAIGAPVPGAAQGDTPLGDIRLNALAASYFAEHWRIDPIAATSAGVHDYDDKLGSYDADGYAERIDLARKTLASLAAIDPATLGAEASYDQQIFQSRLQSTVLSLATMETWKHQPVSYSDDASNAALDLLSRDFAPLGVRVRALVARERQMPSMLQDATANITSVDAVTAGIARRDIAGAIEFFTTVVPAGVAPLRDAALQTQFAASNAAVVAALHAYLTALEAGPFAHPSGTFAVGASRFEEMLRYQELTPIPLALYESVGESALANTKAAFIATAAKIDATKSPQEVMQTLSASHPAAGDLLRKATGDLAALRAFVVAHHILTLPADDDVSVAATPEFERSTTFASLSAPGPLEQHATHAFYYVTPVDPSWSADRQAQHLAFYNDYAFPLVSAHEVMPGHYANFILDRHEKLSMIRELLRSPSFSEGWAHYVEQMVVDEGWGEGDPRVRLAQLQGALLRECRYLVGLREHTQNMSVDEAARFFEANAFVGAEPAEREALRGAGDPLYGYYTLGKLELLKLRSDYQRSVGSRYSLQNFHDALLAHGDPPFTIARKLLLGADDDGKLL
jgi:uncharacterized protein (DUF885 family)